MTLERAVQVIMDEMYKWMDYNIKEDKKTFIVTNFGNNFIHHCNNILRNTEEFKQYYRLNFAKPRNLVFDFDDEFQLKYVRWFNPEGNDSIARLNEELSDYITSKRYDYFVTAPPVKQENDYTLQISNKTQLLDFKKLEAFSF